MQNNSYITRDKQIGNKSSNLLHENTQIQEVKQYYTILSNLGPMKVTE